MKTLTTALLLTVFSAAYSQKIYQSGRYYPQKLRPTDTATVKGIILNKYKVSFFNWVTVVNGNTTYKVSIADSSYFKKLSECNYIELNNCFKLDTKQWKRRQPKIYNELGCNSKRDIIEAMKIYAEQPVKHALEIVSDKAI